MENLARYVGKDLSRAHRQRTFMGSNNGKRRPLIFIMLSLDNEHILCYYLDG